MKNALRIPRVSAAGNLWALWSQIWLLLTGRIRNAESKALFCTDGHCPSMQKSALLSAFLNLPVSKSHICDQSAHRFPAALTLGILRAFFSFLKKKTFFFKMNLFILKKKQKVGQTLKTSRKPSKEETSGGGLDNTTRWPPPVLLNRS